MAPDMQASMALDLQLGSPLELPWLAGAVVDLGAAQGRADAVLSRGARYPRAVRGWEAELVTCTDISNWPVALTRDLTGLWYYCVISDQN